ncbi:MULTISPECIES: type I secretion system permease/ATPase [unclassified Pseudoalteromonas]|uniref:type I secretion system permease/ATPase n=1 Tax=unclassified Pseudoalteromonas TaxID=194690 RepID=UPI0005A8264D|nr:MULTISPECIES: type I secretion system permease/ATPase [unclassified Pseudoalteromonas]
MINEKDTLAQSLELNRQEQDPLLGCLVFLSKFYGKPFSAEAMSSGLPLEDGKLSPKLMPRAALRAGMETKLKKKELKKLPSLMLPCVLMLKDGRACVLLSYKEDKLEIVWPDLPSSHDLIEREQIEDEYSGYCFYIRKRYRFDERAKETLKTNHGHWFWSTLKLSTPIYKDVLLAAFFVNLFAVSSPLFVMNVYDRVVPNQALDTLWVLAFGMFIILVFDFILKEIKAHLLETAAKKSDLLLSSTLFEKTLSLDMSNRPPSVGAFAKQIQEFESIRDFITSATVSALLDVPFSLIFLIIIAVVAGPIVWIPLVGIIIMLVFSFWIKGKIKFEVEQGSRFSVQKNAHLVESLQGIETIKLTGSESQFQSKWEQLIGHIANWNIKIKKYATSVGSVNSLVAQVANVFVVIFGVYQITEGNISMGAMIASVMLTGRAMSPFSQVALLITRYNQAHSALNTLDEIMELPGENMDRYLHRGHFDGEIKFEKVNFAYPGAQINALTDVSFNINSGEKVAIIGRIGAGKTSIEKLLVNFYQPSEGAIRIDGIDIKQISPADLRQKIGCLAQDSTLFFGSIRDNITLGVPHVDDALITRAAGLAGVTRFTDIDPEGLDRQVGERGCYLSGGQRQAVALARALLFNPPMLVLDEPTSSMDNFSESEIKNNIKGIIQDKTFILITHKASMLDLVDRILVMERGRLVADGPRDKVLEALKSGKIKAAL